MIVTKVTVETPATGHVILNADAAGRDTTFDGLFATCSVSEDEFSMSAPSKPGHFPRASVSSSR